METFRYLDLSYNILVGLTVEVFGLAVIDASNIIIPQQALDSSNNIIYNVVSIRDGAFFDNTSIITVDMSANTHITYISNDAFNSATSISHINCPNVTTIGNLAFIGSALSSINCPNVTTIGNSAFCNTNLSSIDCPNVTIIDDSAFSVCTNLSNINCPNLMTIGFRSFYNCTAITTLTLPPKLISIGFAAFSGCTSLSTIDVNSTIDYSLTTIESNAFEGCPIITLIFPASLITIGSNVFSSFITAYFLGTTFPTFFNDTFLNNSTTNAFYNSIVSPNPPQSSNGSLLSDYFTCIPFTPIVSFNYSPSSTNTTITWSNIVVDQPVIYSITNSNDPFEFIDLSGNNITSYTFTDLKPSTKYEFVMHINLNPEIQTIPINFETSAVPISDICFFGNTPIVTDQGIININKIDTKINTINNKKIVAITKTYSNKPYLLCIPKNTFWNNFPSNDIIVSEDHKILYKNKMVKVSELIHHKIYKIKYNKEILYNILLQSHDTIVVNNLIFETLHPNNIIAKLYTIYNFDNISKLQQEDAIQQIDDIVLKINANNYSKKSVKKMGIQYLI